MVDQELSKEAWFVGLLVSIRSCLQMIPHWIFGIC